VLKNPNRYAILNTVPLEHIMRSASWFALLIAAVVCACSQVRPQTNERIVSIWDTPICWKQTVYNETVCPAHPDGFTVRVYCDQKLVAVVPPKGDAVVEIAKQIHPNSYELTFEGVSADGRAIVRKTIAANNFALDKPRPTWRLNRYTLFGDPVPAG